MLQDGEAFKALMEYTRELANPAVRAENEAFMSQLEAEGNAPVNKTILRPAAAFSLDVKLSSSDNTVKQHLPPLLCVNVVTHDSVEAPTLKPPAPTTGTTTQRGGSSSDRGVAWRLPHFAGPLHYEVLPRVNAPLSRRQPHEKGGASDGGGISRGSGSNSGNTGSSDDAVPTVDVCVHPEAVVTARRSDALLRELSRMAAEAGAKQWAAVSAASSRGGAGAGTITVGSFALRVGVPCVGGSPRTMLVPAAAATAAVVAPSQTKKPVGVAASSPAATASSRNPTLSLAPKAGATGVKASGAGAVALPLTASGALILTPAVVVTRRSRFALAAGGAHAASSAASLSSSSSSDPAVQYILAVRMSFPGVGKASQLTVDLKPNELQVQLSGSAAGSTATCSTTNGAAAGEGEVAITREAAAAALPKRARGSSTVEGEDEITGGGICGNSIGQLYARVRMSVATTATTTMGGQGTYAAVTTPTRSAELCGFARTPAQGDDVLGVCAADAVGLEGGLGAGEPVIVAIPIPNNGLRVVYRLSLRLPETVDPDAITAAAQFVVNTGVLTITAPCVGRQPQQQPQQQQVLQQAVGVETGTGSTGMEGADSQIGQEASSSAAGGALSPSKVLAAAAAAAEASPLGAVTASAVPTESTILPAGTAAAPVVPPQGDPPPSVPNPHGRWVTARPGGTGAAAVNPSVVALAAVEAAAPVLLSGASFSTPAVQSSGQAATATTLTAVGASAAQSSGVIELDAKGVFRIS